MNPESSWLYSRKSYCTEGVGGLVIVPALMGLALIVPDSYFVMKRHCHAYKNEHVVIAPLRNWV